MSKRKVIKGTVSLQNGYINPIEVLRAYVDWAWTPKVFGEKRAMELAAACLFALQAMDENTLYQQEQIEWESHFAPELRKYRE